MSYKWLKMFIIFLFISALSGCIQDSQQSIINSHAEALLTKNNELQFRFKINDNILTDEEMYKVRVSIHNEELAAALGTDEIIYGSDTIFNGEYLEANNKNGNFLFMNPIPLNKDLHVFEIEDMIENKDAVSVEVYNGKETVAKAFLNNFASQL